MKAKSQKSASSPAYNCDGNWAQFEQWAPTINQRLATMEQRMSALEQRVAVLAKTPRRGTVTGKPPTASTQGNVLPIK
jgi:hypothetical protein